MSIPPLSSYLFNNNESFIEGLVGGTRASQVAATNINSVKETITSLRAKLSQKIAEIQKCQASLTETQSVISAEKNPRKKEAAQSLATSIQEKIQKLTQRVTEETKKIDKLFQVTQTASQILNQSRQDFSKTISSMQYVDVRTVRDLAIKSGLYHDPFASYLGFDD